MYKKRTVQEDFILQKSLSIIITVNFNIVLFLCQESLDVFATAFIQIQGNQFNFLLQIITTETTSFHFVNGLMCEYIHLITSTCYKYLIL